MYVQFLGTGAGVPSSHRKTQSIAFNFMQELGECFVFDCGEGMQHALLETDFRPAKITKIFISHFHGDHILGLIGFLLSRSHQLNKDQKDITIYGPKGIKEYVLYNLQFTKSRPSYEINFVEFDGNKTILENDKVKVSTFLLNHTVESYAYKIKFKDSVGNILKDKLLEIGIKPSPFYKMIKENETFIYENKVYNSKDFLTEDKKGIEISIISDTGYFDELAEFVSSSDILLTECTYLDKEEYNLAKKYKHINIIDVYNFSKRKKFDKIYLMHISSRYDKERLYFIKNNFLENNMILTRDLDKFEL